MENLKKIKYSDCNLMVYVKSSISLKYEPLQSLKTFTIAPNLMYACLIPFEKLETLKDWMTSNEENAKKYSLSFQIRSSKNRKKVLFQIN